MRSFIWTSIWLGAQCFINTISSLYIVLKFSDYLYERLAPILREMDASRDALRITRVNKSPSLFIETYST